MFDSFNHNNSTVVFCKRDLILIAVVCIAAVLLFFGNKRFFFAPAATIEISIDGKVTKTLDLSRNQTFIIESITGGQNTLIIEDGSAWVTNASCPDKVCEHQGKISMDGQMIVCLPNLMIAKITGP